MNKKEIAAYFDRQAPFWDQNMVTDRRKIQYILDVAGIRELLTVLDVACGTGVLFPYYLERSVSHVIGVDLSIEMIRVAGTKFHDPRVEVICGDIEMIPICRMCDCCVVYNAFPHFVYPARLIARLSQWIKPTGRLTVAHSMGLDSLHRHHMGQAKHVSHKMLPPQELATLFNPWFQVDTAMADEEKHVVSGTRKPNVHWTSPLAL